MSSKIFELNKFRIVNEPSLNEPNRYSVCSFIFKVVWAQLVFVYYFACSFELGSCSVRVQFI